MASSVSIRIIAARDLVAADRNGKSDPYVKCKVGKHKGKTSVIKKNLNPEWNERIEFASVNLHDKEHS